MCSNGSPEPSAREGRARRSLRGAGGTSPDATPPRYAAVHGGVPPPTRHSRTRHPLRGTPRESPAEGVPAQPAHCAPPWLPPTLRRALLMESVDPAPGRAYTPSGLVHLGYASSCSRRSSGRDCLSPSPARVRWWTAVTDRDRRDLHLAAALEELCRCRDRPGR
jgi:hypothetical protein